jgi:hypothetical protein
MEVAGACERLPDNPGCNLLAIFLQQLSVGFAGKQQL